MKNKLLFGAIATGTLTLGSLMTAGSANAMTFSFGCSVISSDCSGLESGILNVTKTAVGSNYQYDILINNTSGNNAEITGLGFDLSPDFDPNVLINWSLTAYTPSGNENWSDFGDEWTVQAGTQGTGFNGQPYEGSVNPNLQGVLDFTAREGSANYDRFTNWFANSHEGLLSFTTTQDLDINLAFLRMQTTGTNGQGSLKLISDPVPTPAVILPVLGGLFGAAFRRQKKENLS